MRLLLRATAAGVGLAALAAVGITAYPAIAEGGGADPWDAPGWHSRLTECEREAGELARKEQVILRRTAVRAETVADLVAGRIDAADAARRFVELNRTCPDALRRVRQLYAGDTDEQRAVWQLVAHVRAYPHPRARAVADETACRLAFADPAP